jgi:hypothetical protein
MLGSGSVIRSGRGSEIGREDVVVRLDCNRNEERPARYLRVKVVIP